MTNQDVESHADRDLEIDDILDLGYESDFGDEREMSILDMSDADRVELSLEDSISQALTIERERCLGPWMCQDGLACHQGQCGGCTTSLECSSGMVCDLSDSLDSDLGRCTSCIEGNTERGCPQGISCTEGVCLSPTIPYYRIEVGAEAWRRLARERYDRTIDVPCQIRMAELTSLDNEPMFGSSHLCEIQVHGGSSRDLSKLSWRLSFDAPVSGLTWGDDRIILRAEYNDLSLLRNALSLLLFEQWTTLPTPRWRHVWLNVNGEDLGLYVQIEKNHDQMMRRWDRSTSAPRYEADQNIEDNLLTGASALVTLPSLSDYWRAYRLSSGLSYAPLIDLIESTLGEVSRQEWGLSQAYTLSRQFVWGSYIRYVAVMKLIQNLDSIRKNYIISLQPFGDIESRWEVYPWDLDLSWGCLYNDVLGTSICDEITFDTPLTLGEISDGAAPTYPTNGLYNTLTERSLSHELAQRVYRQKLCDLAKPLDNNPAIKRIFRYADAYAAKLSPWVAIDDSYRGGSVEVFMEAIETIKVFWENRRQLIIGELSCGE